MEVRNKSIPGTPLSMKHPISGCSVIPHRPCVHITPKLHCSKSPTFLNPPFDIFLHQNLVMADKDKFDTLVEKYYEQRKPYLEQLLKSTPSKEPKESARPHKTAFELSEPERMYTSSPTSTNEPAKASMNATADTIRQLRENARKSKDKERQGTWNEIDRLLGPSCLNWPPSQ